MKKTILTIAILCSTVLVYGQKYYTLAACSNDPLKYIEKNYEDNADSYIGETMGEWADECEIKLEYFMPGRYSPWGTPKHLLGKIESIFFEIYHLDYEYDIYIYIDPSTPLDWGTAVDLEGDYDEPWGPKFYNFYKNAKIKKVKVYKRENGKRIENYRRP